MEKPVKIVNIKFVGIDDWNRPVYKDVDTTIHYGSVNILFPDKRYFPEENKESINKFFRENIGQLEYFGSEFNCEPHGGIPAHYQLTIID